MRKLFLLLGSIWLGTGLLAAQTFDNFVECANNEYESYAKASEKGRYADAAQSVKQIVDCYDKLSDADKKTFEYLMGDMYYNMACCLSMIDKTDEAIIYFKKAISIGMTASYQTVLGEKLLHNLGDKPNFIAALQELKEQHNYMLILTQTSPYNNSQNADYLPKFTYQLASDTSLQRVREYFNLDSIAGSGDELSKIINLLSWSSTVVRHEGKGNPSKRNAIDLVEVCQKEDRGVVCRMKSIILNECYLAMGFKSRIVMCAPKNDPMEECHVINIVYSKTLKKWLWVDPTNNAYLCDESGTVLSIAEVRERAISHQPIILNSDASCNGVPVTKQSYIDDYMIKNLYWFECLPLSAFDIETFAKGKPVQDRVRLYPEGYKRKDDSSNLQGYSKHITNNADYFWGAPI